MSAGKNNINFNAQHSPMGAFMSFTCGQFGAGGGIGVEIGKPAGQNLYIGVKDGDRSSAAPLKCLPFYRASRQRRGGFSRRAGGARGAAGHAQCRCIFG